jgi:predicted HicB family RNase H-like nuclease
MEHTTVRKKTGRPSKGDRRHLSVRLPPALADQVQQHAASQGLSFNDLVSMLLSREVGLPYSCSEGALLTRRLF